VSAADELVELVERAAAAERAVLAARWKDRDEVENMARTARRAADRQRDLDRTAGDPTSPGSGKPGGGAPHAGGAVTIAKQLAERLGGVVIPVTLVILSSFAMWFLLTIFAMALAQQPRSVAP